MIELLAQIDAPHFNCAVVLVDDVVVDAAPIVGYMKRQRWTRERVRGYCRKQGWTITVVYEKKIIFGESNADETPTS